MSPPFFFLFSNESDVHLLVIYLNGEGQQCETSRRPDNHKVIDAIYLSSFTFLVIFSFSARYDEFTFSVYTPSM